MAIIISGQTLTFDSLSFDSSGFPSLRQLLGLGMWLFASIAALWLIETTTQGGQDDFECKK